MQTITVGDMIQIIDFPKGCQELWAVRNGGCYKVRKVKGTKVYIHAKRKFKSNATTKRDEILLKPNEYITVCK